ncbi:MAG: guanine deaminase [Rhodomicrobiaceae bacterium]
MNAPSSRHALRGQILSFRDDPFLVGPDDAILFESDGAIVVEDGLIAAAGPADDVLRNYPDVTVEHYRQDLIMAGFVDSHVHYPQCEVIASYGEQLLEWLNRYTFPAEEKFASPEYAAAIAGHFLDQCLRNGTTTASVYCTVHPQSADALFAAAEERGIRLAAGKIMMDRNAPEALCDTPQRGYDESKALIERWHGRARLTYAITPRFALTSTPEQLEAAGALWREFPDTLMQTHLSENHAEIEWVRSLFPDAPDYFGVYERFGLVGPGSNFGHAIHLTQRERDAMRATGSGISHCPTSNAFLGSGLFDMADLREGSSEIPVGLATDIGGGSSISMFQTMKTSYEICRLGGFSLHPAKAYYLATLGSARLMRLDDRIGNIAPGREADLIIIDLKSTPAIEHRMRYARDLWETLFIQMIMADDRAIRATWVNGSKLYERDRS